MRGFDSARDLRSLGKVWAGWHVQVAFINDPLPIKRIWVLRRVKPIDEFSLRTSKNMNNPDTQSNEDTVYVCGACGKTAEKREDFSDVSCSINAVLCLVSSLEKDNSGRVYKAEAAKEQSDV